jgi:hypothetical protein
MFLLSEICIGNDAILPLSSSPDIAELIGILNIFFDRM